MRKFVSSEIPLRKLVKSLVTFAFEGFFNWIETGTWTTSSTEKLNNEMWIWPTTIENWIFGYGRFGSYVFATDIGYCRLILYAGIIGFIPISLLFIFSGLNFSQIYYRYRYMFLIFIAMTFIFWIKVATDIFYLYALFYNFIDKEEANYNNKRLE